MKTLSVIFLFLLAIATSVAISLYLIEQQGASWVPDNAQEGRYKLIFGQIKRTTSEPSGEPHIANVKPTVEPICFKFDSATGKTWRYVSDFYRDPNEIITTRGFERVLSDDEFPYQISDVTKVRPEKPLGRRTITNTESFGDASERRPSLEDLLADKMWVKCNNPDCKAEYEMGKQAYFKYVEENIDPMAMVAPPVVCQTCGKESVYRAEKCQNPDCAIVFFRGSVPNDFADRCPECGRSETEEGRKRTRTER